MTVSHVFSDMKLVAHQPRFLSQSQSYGLKMLMKSAVLCNGSKIQTKPDHTKEVVGYPTETGIFRSAFPVIGGIDGAQQVKFLFFLLSHCGSEVHGSEVS